MSDQALINASESGNINLVRHILANKSTNVNCRDI